MSVRKKGEGKDKILAFVCSSHRNRGHSSTGRAPALQAGGREFDPPWLHQTEEGSWAVESIGLLRESYGLCGSRGFFNK